MTDFTTHELRGHIVKMIQDGELMDFAQKKVNELVPQVAARFPEIAKKEPKMLGHMAKASVMSTLLQIGFGNAQEALNVLIRREVVTMADVDNKDWKGLLVATLYMESKA